MGFKRRLKSVAAVIVMAAALLYGTTINIESEVAEGEIQEEEIAWYDRTDTIYFWYSDESLTNFINSAAVSFGEAEEVRVIPVLTSESEYLEAINDASLNTEQGPDAYIVSHDLLEKAYLAGLACTIQDVEGVCNEKNFPDAAMSAVSYQGKEIAYPLYFETSALVYNVTHLGEWAQQAALRELIGIGNEEGLPDVATAIATVGEERWKERTELYFQIAIPENVDKILTIANTFELPEGVEGVFKWDVSDIFYNYWFVGQYAVVGGDTGDNPENINIFNDEIIQCLEVYKALNQFFYIESDTVNYESVVEDFCQGKLVFTIATTDVISKLAEAKGNGSIDFEYGITVMPDVSGNLESRAMSVTNAVAINGYSKNKELANRFAAYLVDECAEEMYERSAKVPAKIATNEDNEEIQMFKQVYADSVPLPKMLETANFWMHLEALFAKVWNGADVTELVQELSDLTFMQIHAAEYELQ